ncbi:MAG: asparaginase, partial [Candidatus Baltobacteraceae bacterium]
SLPNKKQLSSNRRSSVSAGEAPLTGAPIVHVTRGPLVESVHEVIACAVDARGKTILALGDIDAPIYLRSSAKPFIAAAAVRAGVVDRFGLEPREVAVMAASHSGEPFHIEAVRSILHKIGMSESALQCGDQEPYSPQAASDLKRDGIRFSAVHNNCSGKHAGILALCRIIGADPATYLQIENPAEQLILELCARMTGENPADLPLGIDGCGIPVFATPARNAALAFMRFATLEEIDPHDARALLVVREAMVAHPQYVSGTGQFDTVLMQTLGDTIAAKGGAEGVHCTAIISGGLGLALKIVDGSARARAPAVLACLAELGAVDRTAMTKLDEFAHPIVYNRATQPVGEVIIVGVSQSP